MSRPIFEPPVMEDAMTEGRPRIDWIQVAHEVGPGFAARAAAHDAGDAFVAENYAELRAPGVFGAGVPAELRGGGASHAELADMLRTLATYCSSTVLALAMHTHQIAIPAWRWRHQQAPVEGFLRRVARDQLILVSSGGSDWLAGSGAAVKVDGGYRVTARKVFGSGAPAGDLLMTMAVYEDPHDGPVVLHFPVPLNAPGVTVQDTWRTLGMRGTGSHDIVLDDVFVPDDAIGVRRPAGRWSPAWHLVATLALPLIYAVYVGIAESARALALRAATRRRDDRLVQRLAGEMDNELTTARLAHRHMLDAAARGPMGDETTNQILIGRVLTGEAAIRTVERALEVAGGAGFFRDLGLERLFRDVQAARYHPWRAGPSALLRTTRSRTRRKRLTEGGPFMRIGILILAATLLTGAPSADADVITDANARAAEIASRHPGTPPAVRIMAIVQTSVFEAVNSITGRYAPLRAKVPAAPGASVDAAVAAATKASLSKLMPTQQAAIDADYQAALTAIPDGPARANGIAVGERAAAAILAWRAEDGAAAPDVYRPHAAAGSYVPTLLPAVPHWGKRKPWVMASSDQFRPAAPPALTSETWARDYNEIKAIGSKTSTQRTPEQTAIAKFWEATAPAVYWPVARSVGNAPGRDVAANARLFALAAMAMDDALIAVFDAKYTYNLWRPITAIRNGDNDRHDATERDAGWTPFIDTPMHPEYPCAHCIVSASLGAVLEAEIGGGPTPKLSSSSPMAGGAVRSWNSVGEFTREVAVARIYDGVHYRNSTEVGTAMGKKIGELAAKGLPRATR